MAKIVLLAVLSIDGYLAEKDGKLRWWLKPENYDIAQIREKASFIVSPETSFEFLKNEVQKKNNEIFLIEGVPELVDVIHKSLDSNIIDRMIIYRIPLLAGGGHLLFTPQRKPLQWKLKESKIYDGNIEKLIYGSPQF